MVGQGDPPPETAGEVRARSLLSQENDVTEDDDEGIHVVDLATNSIKTYVWTAFCGAQCVVWDDGSTEPPSFDFYRPRDGAKATCKRCLAALALRPTDNREP